ncbi:cystatin-like [Thamnophis elegans]|uniref:cystatin-like n=1 Tax=Thamnophis elegans TaxID=35005 RepID=UPI0013788A04|nr:cystatin-like [Thamnophis elegans]
MVRSRRPLPSLFDLFRALLMLSPELLMGNPRGLFDVSLSYPGVQKALAFVVEAYNQKRIDIANYFKLRGVLTAQAQVKNGKIRRYRFKLELVETTCEKKTNTLTYKKIQQFIVSHCLSLIWTSEGTSSAQAKDSECVRQLSNLWCTS